MEREWQEGDRVVLADPDRWLRPVRSYANRRATVLKVFTPIGATRPCVKVRFDMKRYPKWDTGQHTFAARDLAPAPPE